MGRKIYDEDLRLNLILNGEGLNNGSKKMVAELGKMEQEMVKMEQQAKVLAASIKNLEKNATANATQLKQEKAEYNQLTKTMKAHELSIEAMRKKVGLAGMTVQQLNNHLKALKLQLYNMPGSAGTPIFKKLQAEITETEIRLRTLTTGASRMSQAWARLEQTANRAGTIFGFLAIGVYAVSRVVGAVITRMKDLEDLLGSVRKNTNLVAGEVWDMKDAFDKWDTRTKTDDLLQMAIVAGKLGVEGKGNIMEFVDSANKIQIALGDDLNGSVEDTMNSVGKLTNAFRTLDEVDTKTGKKFTLGAAMLRTGDVLNQLAKTSAASAGTILEYMTRLAGVSELAKFTIAQVGGLGSVLDALNVPSERGATALQKIMLQLANPKKIQDFAEALGTTADGYKQMLANDPNKVLTELLRKFVSSKNGLVELTGGLKDFGVKGQYMISVLGSLGQNLDVLAEQQGIAGKAWQDGTSVLSEYDIMNNNFTADVLKQQKIISAQTDHFSREAEPAVVGMITAWASFIVGIRTATDWIGKHWTAVKALTFAFIALNAPTLYRITLMTWETAVTVKNIVVKKLKLFWENAELLSIILLSRGTEALTARQILLMNSSRLLTFANTLLTQGFRAAWIELMILSGVAGSFAVTLGAVAVVVAALGAAFYFLVIRQKELTEIEKAHQKLQQDIATDYGKQKATLDVLIGRLKDVKISEQERTDILKKIKDEYGQYLPLLEKEGLTAKDVADSYDLIIDAMGRKITYEKNLTAAGENRNKLNDNQKEIDKIKAKMEAAPQKKIISPYAGEQDPLANKYAEMQADLKILEDIQRAYTIADSQFNATLQANAPPAKGVKNKLGTIESDDTFKARQAKRDSELKEEEVLIKEGYTKKLDKQDEMNKKLRAANLSYLDATLQDYVDSGRTEESAYLDMREKRADLMLGVDKKEAVKTKSDNKISLKNVKEYEQELIDVEKLRIETITNEHEKDVATEDERHLQAMFKNRANDQAMEYEEIIHNQNITEINEKYLDKQLADKTLSYMQKKMLLDKMLGQELIDQKAYWAAVVKLTHDEETDLMEFKKQYGLLNNGELVNLEITELKKGVFWVLLTEEEKEKAIDQIRLKYGRARAKRLKKTLEEELNDIKEGFTKEQQVSFEAGEILIPLFQKMGEGMGDAFVSMFDKSQNAFAVFSKNMLLVAIDETKKYIELQYVKMMARNVATMGPVGVVVTLGEIALIEAAFAFAKGMVNKIDTAKPVNQKADGSYPVLGASDGRTYSAIYGGSPHTGVYSRPTLLNMSDGRSLVGERAPELVVDGDTFRRIQLNAPGLLRDIYAYAGRFDSAQRPVKQMAEGSYPGPSNSSPASGSSSVIAVTSDPELKTLMNKLDKTLNGGIRAYINKYGTNGLMEAQDDIAKLKTDVNYLKIRSIFP